MEKPDVDHIDGLSPAVSIDQKGAPRNPRSTVGTVTEIYDYLRLLYARVGVPHCPKCGKPISRQTPEQIVDHVLEMPEGRRILVLGPIVRGRKGEYRQLFQDLRRQGFARVRVDGNLYELGEEIPLDKNRKHQIEVVVDRLIVRPDIRSRLNDSVETALKLGQGVVGISVVDGEEFDVQPELRLSRRRRQPAGDRTQALLVQRAVRGVPDLHGSRVTSRRSTPPSSSIRRCRCSTGRCCRGRVRRPSTTKSSCARSPTTSASTCTRPCGSCRASSCGCCCTGRTRRCGSSITTGGAPCASTRRSSKGSSRSWSAGTARPTRSTSRKRSSGT